MRRLTHIFTSFAIAGCAVSIPVVRGASPPTRAPAGAAIVLFLLGDNRDPQHLIGGLPRAWPTGRSRGVDILDERGELLGRLRSRSWLAVERPPGPQTFYAVPTDWLPICLSLGFGPCPEADAGVGMLRANLEPGEIYAVWLGVRVQPATMAAASLCRRADWEEDSIRPRMSSFEMFAVSGAGWATVDHLFNAERTVAIPAAPRGVRHPSADRALAGAEARVNRCWNEVSSTLDPDDGFAERP